MNPSPSWNRCEHCPNSRAFSVPAPRARASPAPLTEAPVPSQRLLSPHRGSRPRTSRLARGGPRSLGPSEPCAPHRGSRPLIAAPVPAHHGFYRGGPRSQRGLCSGRAPLSLCPARGRPGRAAARTCCCPPRRALCRDARGADVTAGVIINDRLYLFICSFVYLLN